MKASIRAWASASGWEVYRVRVPSGLASDWDEAGALSLPEAAAEAATEEEAPLWQPARERAVRAARAAARDDFTLLRIFFQMCIRDRAKIALAMRISRKCRRIVHQNIVFALAVKAACLVLGAVGIANMWAAIFADVGVMVLAVLNATRMLSKKV